MSGKLKKRNHYDDDYKRETVRRLLESGQPVSVFAHHAGVEQSVLHRWVKRYDDKPVVSSLATEGQERDMSVQIKAMREEIELLRRSVSMLRAIMEKAFRERYVSDSPDEKRIYRLFETLER